MARAKQKSTAAALEEPTRAAAKPAKQQRKEQAPDVDSKSGGSVSQKDALGMKSTELAKHTNYFLIKDEPSDYSIEMLEKEKAQTAEWDGVRNHTAKNVILEMHKGNQVLFYRSGAKGPGVVGIVEVAKDPYPDHTSWDNSNKKAFDPKSTPEEPRWWMVDIKLATPLCPPPLGHATSDPNSLPSQKKKFDQTIPLATLKKYKEAELEGLALLKISRLSVMPLTKEHFEFIVSLKDDADHQT